MVQAGVGMLPTIYIELQCQLNAVFPFGTQSVRCSSSSQPPPQPEGKISLKMHTRHENDPAQQ